MKKIWNLIMVLTIATILAACGGGENEESTTTSGEASGDSYEKATIRLAYNLPAEHHISKGIEEFAKQVTERSGGQVEVVVYPSGQLLSDKDMNQSILTGGVEIGLNSATLWSSTVPELGALDLPYIFTDYNQAGEALAGEFGDILRQAMEAKGAKVLLFGDYGFSQFANSVRPLKTPDDFKGLKFRSFGDIPSVLIEAYGGAPTFMGSGEVYTALQRGTVDGATSGTTAMLQRNYNEVTKYLTINNYASLQFPLVMNKAYWDKLPEKTQTLIEEVASEQEQWIREQAKIEDERTAKELEEKGMEVYVVPEEELVEWKEKAQPVIDQFIENNGEQGQKLLDLVQ
ncbi:tripartite ATP-independent transporter DctP family solute receptor [Lysinibacillus composti]|uniref:DctP family TRAP transporter solute-binding subunit n=1 Tax=Lysinibacillus composti TaxID=720633 RepID=A0A3N9UPK4_9BACI|nr:DctP family TRAP transporter solute-binding subunit [Lysinibacillus composti]MBM7609513.1 tripartite ATP-independent transporter DctP family solute receptor [Lysinibacillus composti]RQW73856.1 DctP family TRAP transporter solute-binding subunit [Lysinibacillus composti]